MVTIIKDGGGGGVAAAPKPSTPVEAFRRHLLTEETTGDSVLEDVERTELRRLSQSLGGKALREHLERKKQWATEQIMNTPPGDAGKVSFLQAFHFFCVEYITLLTPPPEDKDDAG